MTPREIIEKLANLGVIITARTLYNYSSWGLISSPLRGASRSGKWVEYPDIAFEEAYAAYCMLHGKYWDGPIHREMGLKPPKLTPETVAAIRRIAYLCKNQKWEEYKKEAKSIERRVVDAIKAAGISDAESIVLLTGLIEMWFVLGFKERSFDEPQGTDEPY